MSLSIFLLCLFVSLLSLCQSKEIVQTIAGLPSFGGDNLVASKSSLHSPSSVFVKDNQIYFSDTNNHIIRKIDSNGVIHTIGGIQGKFGFSGNGLKATESLLYHPHGLFVTTDGEVYIADTYNHLIRKIDTNGTLHTVAGSSGEFNFPSCIVQFQQEWYICDSYNHVIQKMFMNGTQSVVVGSMGIGGYSGDDLDASMATLNTPTSLHFDNVTGDMFIVDFDNHVIRQVFARNGTITTIYRAENCSNCTPSSVFVDNQVVYFTDSVDCTVKKIQNNTVATIAGMGNNNCGVDIQTQSHMNATSTTLNSPTGLFVVNEKIYLADTYNHIIRMIDLKTNLISTIAGTHNNKIQSLSLPSNIALTSQGDLYIADTFHHVIKKVNREGKVTILAGNLTKQPGYNGDGIPAKNATLYFPQQVISVEFNNTVELFIADTYNHIIRKVDAKGIISTVAGIPNLNGYTPWITNATNTLLSYPYGLCYNNDTKELYIVDNGNSAIRILQNDMLKTIVTENIELLFPHLITMNTNTETVYLADTNGLYQFFNNSITQIYSSPFIQGIFALQNEQQLLLSMRELNSIHLFENGTLSVVNQISSFGGLSGDGSALSLATFWEPKGLFATNSSIYITNSHHHIIRKVAPQCSSSEVYFSAPQLYSMSIQFSVNQICSSNIDHILPQYAPIVTVNYQSSSKQRSQFGIAWTENIEYNITGRELDLLQVSLNACYEQELAIQNCSIEWNQFGVVPAVPLLILESNVTHSSIAISPSSYQVSASVSSLQVLLRIVNQQNEFSSTMDLITPSSTFSTLKSCTVYTVLSQANVTYSNELSLLSSIHSQELFQQGIFPISNVRNIQLNIQGNSFLVTWLPVNSTFDLPIVNQLQIQYSSSISVATIVTLNYVVQNTSHVLTNITREIDYSVQLRICNDLCCGEWSQEVIGRIPNEINIALILAIVIPLAIVLLLVGVLFVILLTVTIVVFIVVLKRRKNTTKTNTARNDELELF